MTDSQIADLGPAFRTDLGRFRDGFLPTRTAAHFDTSAALGGGVTSVR